MSMGPKKYGITNSLLGWLDWIIGGKKTNTYWMEETKLNKSECEKDLGIHVDDDLDFSEHITSAVKKSQP